MLEILVCVESRIYRDGLELLLSRRPNVGCIVVCDNVRAIGNVSHEGRFDVILVDVSLGTVGFEPRVQISETYRMANGAPIIALGFDEADDEVLGLIEAGAAAFVSKGDSIDDLVEIIESVACGEPQLSPHMVRLMQERLTQLTCHRQDEARSLGKLSQRERHILDLVSQQLSNKQIARTLGLEVSTIKNHMHNIISKLGVKNRSEAAARVLTTSRA
ncbi:MAG: LuxR C-terminal-related transcriptional regulator [Hyphomicrobium sp.]